MTKKNAELAKATEQLNDIIMNALAKPTIHMQRKKSAYNKSALFSSFFYLYLHI